MGAGSRRVTCARRAAGSGSGSLSLPLSGVAALGATAPTVALGRVAPSRMGAAGSCGCRRGRCVGRWVSCADGADAAAAAAPEAVDIDAVRLAVMLGVAAGTGAVLGLRTLQKTRQKSAPKAMEMVFSTLLLLRDDPCVDTESSMTPQHGQVPGTLAL